MPSPAMQTLDLMELLRLSAPVAVIVLGVLFFWQSSRRWLRPDPAVAPGKRQLRLIGFFVGSGIWLLLLLIAILFAANQTDQDLLLWLVGGAISVVITLSSTSFVSNTLAGIALQIMAHFRIGDYIEVHSRSGRVQSRSLLHIQVENDDGDLIILPNVYILSQPLTVVPESGTVVSATVSLGYDVSHSRAEEALLQAVEKAGLKDPFVLVLELGDFSVTYRFGGKLAPVKQLLTTRSRLRRSALDALHAAQVEIVSPTFMNQRALEPEHKIIPRDWGHSESEPETAADEVIFEQSGKAHEQERLRKEMAEIKEELAALQKEGREAEGEIKERQESRREALEERMEAIGTELKALADADSGQAADGAAQRAAGSD